MADPFFDQPILNSPYECPQRHWELDSQGQLPWCTTPIEAESSLGPD